MTTPKHHALTPEALLMMDAIARNGSFAAAARELGRVPSALTYSVRQLEEALDVLLFDRRSGQARLTPAGNELLVEGRRLLAEMSGVANRVRRVATGWETELTLAVDGALSQITMLELVEAFYDHRTPGRSEGARPASAVAEGPPPTRLRLRTEVLAGTWDALVSGQADLAVGVSMGTLAAPAGFEVEPLGSMAFRLAVAPSHPLAQAEEPVSDEALMHHRAVAVADSASRLSPLTVNLLPGQDVLTVATMEAKLEAIARGLGCGFLPEPLLRVAVQQGRLVLKAVRRPADVGQFGYAWRRPTGGTAGAQGLALSWWVEQLRSPATRRALLERHG